MLKFKPLMDHNLLTSEKSRYNCNSRRNYDNKKNKEEIEKKVLDFDNRFKTKINDICNKENVVKKPTLVENKKLKNNIVNSDSFKRILKKVMFFSLIFVFIEVLYLSAF